MAGNRTRVNCLEGSYAHHYTTIAGFAYNYVPIRSARHHMRSLSSKAMGENCQLNGGEEQGRQEFVSQFKNGC